MSARDVWERLERDGWAELERWLEERAPEGLHLDFKEKGRESPSFDEADLGRVAKAVSAFANVEGGVLVLGVRADGATRTDPDRVTAIPGVPDAEKALGLLERRLTGLTDPPVAGARVLAVREQRDAGRVVLAVMAPQSDGGPHRSVVGKEGDRYFMRVASNSLPAPHAILAGMFGRRPPPRLRLGVCREANGEGSIFVRNHGRGIARDVFVRLTIDDVHNQNIMLPAGVTGWKRERPTRMRATPVYTHGLRGELPVHALDTVRIASFSQSDSGARVFISARIDAEGIEPVRSYTGVSLNGGWVIDVPAAGEDGHDDIQERTE
jgi:Putative DNA-binding domain